MLKLIQELAAYEKMPEEVTVDPLHFEESGFGSNPVWWAFVVEEGKVEKVEGVEGVEGVKVVEEYKVEGVEEVEEYKVEAFENVESPSTSSTSSTPSTTSTLYSSTPSTSSNFSTTNAHHTGFGPNPLSSKCKGSTVTSSGIFSYTANSWMSFSIAGQSSLVALLIFMIYLYVYKFSITIDMRYET